MDEAGNTGENLLDPAQPVYSLAALHVSVASVEPVVEEALKRTQMPELKFAKLRTSNPGRKNILSLLTDVELGPDVASVSVVHKPWMLAAKLVDELVEPRMLRDKVQMEWYASGTAKAMAHVLYARGQQALGGLYNQLATSFLPLVRDFSTDAAEGFLSALRRCRVASQDPHVTTILSSMIDSHAELADEFASREDALDPALPTLFWQACRWSAAFDEPFEILHDDSNTVQRWSDYLTQANKRHRDAEENAGHKLPLAPSLRVGEIEILAPDHLHTISFGESHRDHRLQMADILAGSAAYLYAAQTGARRFDPFACELHAIGLEELIENPIGPGPNEIASPVETS
jgi:Protein of unknown function (DUF3800)